jgi:hypothetical protein
MFTMHIELGWHGIWESYLNLWPDQVFWDIDCLFWETPHKRSRAILKNNGIRWHSLCIVEAHMTPKISPELMYVIIATVAFVLMNR